MVHKVNANGFVRTLRHHVVVVVNVIISNDDDNDGSENVAKK